jgi:hypothetical protein
MANKRPDLTPSPIKMKIRIPAHFIKWCNIVINGAVRECERAARERLQQKGAGK